MMPHTMQSINPATEELIAQYDAISDEVVSDKIDQAHIAYQAWRFTDFSTRHSLMKKLASLLETHKETYARLITQEMGKIYQESVAEIEKSVSVCHYYADNAEQLLLDEEVATEAQKSLISYQPLGCILAVMPWNFPFWQVFRFAAPTIMAGNVGLLKHASNVSGCSLAIEQLFIKAGFPSNIFTSLLISSGQVEKIIEHHLIRAVTLTGSEQAGRKVAAKAGECLKKTVLELGGSDPYLILADADLELAADLCVKSRLLNAGQSCIAAKRFIVVESVYDTFLALFTQKMQAIIMGDPMDNSSDIGSQASIELRDALHKQVSQSVRQGAKCILGGVIPTGKGAYYPPTILTNVTKQMPAFNEELFGPVASIIKVKDEEEAIIMANAHRYGLGGAVFTQDKERGMKIAKERIESGSCVVNDFVKSDPRLPFGGIKDSGYGRELAKYGIHEFVNVKTLQIG